MSRISNAFGVLMFIALATAQSASSSRQILAHERPSPAKNNSTSSSKGKGTCRSPIGMKVPNARKKRVFRAKGDLIFYCNNSKLDLRGEGGANLTGPNGWKGKFYYPDDTGLATYSLRNTKNGKTRFIEAKKGPFARSPSKDWNGNAIGGHRRRIKTDTAKLKATWLVRDLCKSARAKPTSTKCNGDRDIIIKYQCRFTFYSC